MKLKGPFLWLSLSSFLLMGGPSAAEPQIPPDHKVINQWGQAEHREIPSRFRMLVWNIHKAADGARWQKDFHELASQSHLVLLQEGYGIEPFWSATTKISSMLWSFATSFFQDGFETGVVTGSATMPLNTFWHRSPGREPILNTPKMTILNEFDLPKSDKHLLVANIHGINFVTNGLFYDHVGSVLRIIEKHNGPVVFAGDFNTWNGWRFDFLKERAQRLGLKLVRFKGDPRNIPLDHILYRGLNVEDSKVHQHIDSSDHYPLSADFILP